MPFATKFVEEGKGFVFRGSGLLTLDEILDARKDFQSDAEAMRRVTFALIDLENVAALRLDAEGVQRMVAIDEHIAKVAGSNMAIAILATSDETFGFARMWATRAEGIGWPITVVRSRAEAHAWLGEMLSHGSQSATLTESTPPKLKSYRVDLALKVMQSDADHTIIWFTRGTKKGAFIFRPSEIQRLNDLDDHFYPSFDVDQVSDLRKLMGASHHFQATLFELRGIMQDVLSARKVRRQ